MLLLIDGLPLAPAISTSFGIIVLWACAWLVITRRLVWHTDLAEVRAQRDRWEGIALTALQAAERLTVHAEVTEKVLSSIPQTTPTEPTAGGESP